jgi:hypothetical protein
MGIFGWSYPPGCNGPPEDGEHEYCMICGDHYDSCICPECKICNSYGDPYCYINHGMRRTEEQKFSLECNNRYWDLEYFKEVHYQRWLDKEIDNANI